MNSSASAAPPAPLPAGNFSDWLRAMRKALAGSEGMEVACGDCRGCCTSSYFIKIRPHETEARQRIGEDCLEPAPNAPPGTMLMGYDSQGHCAMFRDGNCSIYSHRPDTCRTYDCRVFAAAGNTPGEDRPVIGERVARWRFEYPSATDHVEQRAVTATANFIRRYPIQFPGGRVPSRPSEVAVLAVKAYQVFLQTPQTDPEIAAAIVSACRTFDQDGV